MIEKIEPPPDIKEKDDYNNWAELLRLKVNEIIEEVNGG